LTSVTNHFWQHYLFNRNVSALARRMGISQNLMAQYISGKKNASKARMALILDTIHTVGRELAAV
jgi:transcriptional regulator with XRE-family HTH domain